MFMLVPMVKFRLIIFRTRITNGMKVSKVFGKSALYKNRMGMAGRRLWERGDGVWQVFGMTFVYRFRR